MIRINLLPSDDRKAKRKISLPTISGGAVLWVSLGLLVYAGAVGGIWVLQNKKINDYETKILALKEESARLAPQLAKIRKLQAEREEVNKRLAIIAALDRDRYLHVRMMNDLAVNVPDNCWLTDVAESGGSKVRIEGITFSNFIIADLMTSLEGSGRFGEVALARAEEGDIEGVRVVKFSVSASLMAN
ncbi:MAG TPA: PilN domain-containing protein [Candidatus Krumholzibacteria bacterium]|nr:PilN domain-containing protein [Candidatus Krumholzibacteria bacterium]